MIQKIKENKILAFIILIAFVMFFSVAYYIMSTNKTITAVVLSGNANAGTVITEDMLKTIEVSQSVPAGFLQDQSSVVGYKLKSTTAADQLLYESDFMSSYTDYTEMKDVPDDYAITSVSIPDERACGGVITTGDYVDIMLVTSPEDESNTGASVKYILSNVKVLSTNSSLAEAQESEMSTASQNSTNSNGSYYVFALSYDDTKKLRSEEGTDKSELWLNLSAKQNHDGKDPLINQMNGDILSGLHDAQKQALDEDGKLLEGIPKNTSTNTGSQTTTDQQ